MKGVKTPGAVAELVDRARRLRGDTRPRWGTLDAHRMLCHVADVARLALGEIPTRRRRPRLLGRFPFKQLALYYVSWPHGVRGPREAFTSSPATLEADVAALESALTRFLDHVPKDEWPPHPLFGSMSARDWDRLLYRHTHHHLRQFGV